MQAPGLAGQQNPPGKLSLQEYKTKMVARIPAGAQEKADTVQGLTAAGSVLEAHTASVK